MRREAGWEVFRGQRTRQLILVERGDLEPRIELPADLIAERVRKLERPLLGDEAFQLVAAQLARTRSREANA